jgi:hypothetical protein
MRLLLALVVLAAVLPLTWTRSADAASCTPLVTLNQSVTVSNQNEITAIRVTLTAAADVKGSDRLERIRFTSATNARVAVNGVNVAVPSEIRFTLHTRRIEFVV